MLADSLQVSISSIPNALQYLFRVYHKRLRIWKASLSHLYAILEYFSRLKFKSNVRMDDCSSVSNNRILGRPLPFVVRAFPLASIGLLWNRWNESHQRLNRVCNTPCQVRRRTPGANRNHQKTRCRRNSMYWTRFSDERQVCFAFPSMRCRSLRVL